MRTLPFYALGLWKGAHYPVSGYRRPNTDYRTPAPEVAQATHAKLFMLDDVVGRCHRRRGEPGRDGGFDGGTVAR